MTRPEKRLLQLVRALGASDHAQHKRAAERDGHNREHRRTQHNAHGGVDQLRRHSVSPAEVKLLGYFYYPMMDSRSIQCQDRSEDGPKVLVSELVARTGVPLPTVKYYMREGVLMPGRAISATRAEYGDEHVHRIG